VLNVVNWLDVTIGGAMTTLAWWQQGVVYQVYPRSFQDENGDGIGDLAGITARLEYLAALGVDAVWLSPVYPSPMADFGYDISDYCSIDPVFGTLPDFDCLIERAHGRRRRAHALQLPTARGGMDGEQYCANRLGL
jgi:1,4-alpha-glucan branching enzyme